MTYDQGVRLASRALSIYMLICALSDFISLPREIGSTLRALHGGSSNYLFAEVGFLLGNVLRILVWLLLAMLFYRCGPRVREFFGPPEENL
jgi:hypothetical protein